MKSNNIPEDLLAKYLAGQCTEAEKAAVEARLSVHDEHTEKLMEGVWRDVQKTSPARNLRRENRGYAAISKTLAFSSRAAAARNVYRIAASLILISTFTFVFYRFGGDMLRALVVKQLHVSTKTGSRERVVLPDGSEVWLNAASTLSYPEKFGSIREVSLQGEAFFKVSEDKSKPFIIRTANFYTTVLGTSFNIKAYDTDRQVRVSVATGKVAVSVADTTSDEVQQLALLTRHQQITYYHDTRAFRTERIPMDYASSWIIGQLAFKQASVAEVASTLQRWFGKPVEVVGMTPATVCTFTANFKEGATLHDVLETLSITRKIDYRVDDDKAIILVQETRKIRSKK